MTEDDVIVALKQIYDPEIPVNIFDLGLIYRINVAPENVIEVDMTLTSPNCPVAGEMPGQVKSAIEALEGAGPVTVNLVWDPPWDRTRMSDEAQMMLGIF